MNESNEFGPNALVIDWWLFWDSIMSNEKLCTKEAGTFGLKAISDLFDHGTD